MDAEGRILLVREFANYEAVFLYLIPPDKWDEVQAYLDGPGPLECEPEELEPYRLRAPPRRKGMMVVPAITRVVSSFP